ncbi:MAG TPA: PHB depolymerase family esterase [Gemmatimonadales bacterium]|nr:PHB depolymerase family esterase [Gemmatimonadales bacterium]
MRTMAGRGAVVALVILLAPGTLCAQGGDGTFHLRSGGLERSYLLHAPAGSGARPLVVLLHGRLGTGAGMAKMTHFDAVADRAGILVAYPDGWRRSWNDGRPGTPAHRRQVDDVSFILAMIDDIGRRMPVDPRRVYVAGMSNGGFMTERLACEAGERFAAVAVDVATLSDSLASTCRLPRPVPAIFFHGTADPLVPYGGGRMGDRGSGLSVDETVATWARWNGCAPSPVMESLPDTAREGIQVTRRTWPRCRDGADVVAYKFDGGGHAWPGGTQYLPARFVGRVSRNVDASEEIGRFFERHIR